MKKAILWANGDPPSKRIIGYLIRAGYNKIICADGGANSARKLNFVPDVIIGDLDSITDDNLNYFSDKSEIIKLNRQNDTDVEKALKYSIKKKFDELILIGATGSRLDHSFCNLGIMLKFYDKIRIKLLHRQSVLCAYEGDVEIKTSPGETVSIYGFDRKTKITSQGLKYPLKETSLPFGEKESTSNVALKDSINLTIKGGRIFLIRDFEAMRKNGQL
ncbi:thiamine pyrophosphokinase [Melioribacter roseus P3M-2]|uniref:Thiamine diphosphokinase n=1 Tax=Melioribacter roseus (strain DSM 23840 / JCM 17771 / VKM B-2668 / P3M-2) TaxID=1191523 RepID=I7A7G8_MELRP|nr:thiamine diphosphokinase [Melioribacter roseus]AFN75821.1 thiamine pyrophosphokinase [Melioribacter roseus P3M-2]